MKSLLIIAALTLSSQVMSSEVLVKLHRGGGYSPLITSIVVEISEKGEITRTRTVKTTPVKKVIGKISANALQVLKDRIEIVDDNVKLIDFDAKKPRCMDAPSSSITINKGGKEIKIGGKSGCHKLGTEDYSANDIANLIQSVEFLGE